MTKALELAKFGREAAPTGLVVGDSDAQTLSSKTFSDGPVFSGLNANGVPYLNASKVLSSSSTFVFDGTNIGLGIASPAATLHVNASGGGTIRASRSSVGGEYVQLDHDGTDGTLRVSGNNKLYLTTNGTTRVTVLGGGNVGIGIQAPTAILHTQSSGLGDGGGIKLGNSGSGGGTFAIWPTATINGEGADKLIFSGSGGNLVTITGAGKVGIGTTIPQLHLDIGSATSNRGISWGGTSGNYVNIWTTYGGADLNIGTNVKPLGNNTGYYSSYADAGTARNIIRLNAFTGNGIQFFTDTQSSVAVDTGVTPSERMRITPAGRVGVGLGTPVTLLHINTGGTARGLTIDNNYNGGAGGTTGMSVANATNDLITLRAGYGDNPETTTNNGMKWGIHFSGNNGDTWPFNGKSAAIYAVSEETANAGYNRKVGLSFWTSSMDTDYAERFRIDNNGRVIINPNQTTTYAGMLDIYGGGSGALGAIRIGDGTYSGGHINYWDIGRDNTVSGDFTFAINASEKMRIKTNGNVGIGNTDPVFKLDVSGGDDTNSFRVYGTSTYGPSVRIQYGGSNGRSWNLISNSADNAGGAGALQFWNSTDAVTSMLMFPNGNIAIGDTTASGYKLKVAGTANVTGALVVGSYASVGSIVANDPGAGYYGYNNRIGGALAVVGTLYNAGNLYANRFTLNQGNAGVSRTSGSVAAGWYRFARSADGGSGSYGARGGCTFYMYTTGGWAGPGQTVIELFKDYSTNGNLTVDTKANYYFTNWRIAMDSNYAYLEGFTPGFSLGGDNTFNTIVDSYGWDSGGWTLYSEPLTAGLSSPSYITRASYINLNGRTLQRNINTAGSEPDDFVTVNGTSWGSAFDNPTIDLFTFPTPATIYANLICEVEVYQTPWSNSGTGNIHTGYANYGNQGNIKNVSTMTVKANMPSAAHTNVGTLSWSGNTLRYTSNRASNYDHYSLRYTVRHQEIHNIQYFI